MNGEGQGRRERCGEAGWVGHVESERKEMV